MISKQLIKAPHIVVPIGFSRLRCGRCRSTDFKIMVLQQNDRPSVQVIRCSKCKNAWRVDNQRFLECTGRVELSKEVISNG